MNRSQDRFCFDLPTSPCPGLKVLVTGATGYIGGELVPELIARGYQIRIMLRKMKAEYRDRWPNAEIVVADALNYEQVEKALIGMDCVFYLIHSLQRRTEFVSLDNQAAHNFTKAAEKNKLKRIVYLGALGNNEVQLSNHLKSRQMVAEVFEKGNTALTQLRAAVIIGSGSASYRMINNLVQNCPVFLFPTWAKTKCQPIAVRDVIKYLVGCLENSETAGKTFDIGGPEILTFEQMVKLQAKILKKKRLYMNGPFSSVDFYARLTSILTPTSYDLAHVLMESCVNDVICLDDEIQRKIPFETMPYEETLGRALIRESQKMIFERKRKAKEEQGNAIEQLRPPRQSKNIFSDLRGFLFSKPQTPTLIKFNSAIERENFSYRILQRLNIDVNAYKMLNVHQIGVEAPAKFVFEELLQWNGDSSCWPNHLAKVVRENNTLEQLSLFLLGIVQLPTWLKKSFLGKIFKPLFQLNAIDIVRIPDSNNEDNARYLLYKCTGGYPIGVFTIYVRSSIAQQGETEKSQLFLMVGFNFYGKQRRKKKHIINRMWEVIHDRVTSNVLNRLKQLSEWRFEQIQLNRSRQG